MYEHNATLWISAVDVYSASVYIKFVRHTLEAPQEIKKHATGINFFLIICKLMQFSMPSKDTISNPSFVKTDQLADE